jgi:hypothetical protein
MVEAFIGGLEEKVPTPIRWPENRFIKKDGGASAQQKPVQYL